MEDPFAQRSLHHYLPSFFFPVRVMASLMELLCSAKASSSLKKRGEILPSGLASVSKLVKLTGYATLVGLSHADCAWSLNDRKAKRALHSLWAAPVDNYIHRLFAYPLVTKSFHEHPFLCALCCGKCWGGSVILSLVVRN